MPRINSSKGEEDRSPQVPRALPALHVQGARGQVQGYVYSNSKFERIITTSIFLNVFETIEFFENNPLKNQQKFS